jgi:pimeloyl-ACP methyl ester carboxylesterase
MIPGLLASFTACLLLPSAPLVLPVHANSSNSSNISNSSVVLARSRCSSGSGPINCEHEVTHIEGRWVGWQKPLGVAPEGGWPMVVLYHGWNLMNSQWAWYATPAYSYGLYHKAETIRSLLDSGFVVVTPDALARLNYWETNTNRYATADLSAWLSSEDHRFVEAILQEAAGGRFGEVDPASISAIGFSSGAYMTSRMAVNYPERFRAFAVVGGSYYYCSGSCGEDVADQLPSTVWCASLPTALLRVHRGAPSFGGL